MTPDELDRLLLDPEGRPLECKEAKNRTDFDELCSYCCAIANERGGYVVLGVTNRRPRVVVGSRALDEPGKAEAQINERLREVRVRVEEVQHPRGRVVVVHVPPRPSGIVVVHRGVPWMRDGEVLVPMSASAMKAIYRETETDFTALPCERARITDLDPAAIAVFRDRWAQRTPKRADAIRRADDRALLNDAELMADAVPTRAALLLFGRPAPLGREIPQAEIVFEYRERSTATRYAHREEIRDGLLRTHDRLWELVNLRNAVQQVQQGLFRVDVPSFNERVVREAVLNAFSHRDYRRPGSIFLRQSPEFLEVASPGGFPEGVTPENILWKQEPRNRRLAEALGRCGLVERSNHGARIMFGDCAREGKEPPDFTGTDDYGVVVKLSAHVTDPKFVEFVERASAKRPGGLDEIDLVVLDAVYRDRPVAERLRDRLPALADGGLIEAIGAGKTRRYIPSKAFYRFAARPGVYTRRRGLDRPAQKELLVQHIRTNRRRGCRLAEMTEVVPSLSSRQVQKLLRDLRSDGRIRVKGRTRAALWFPSAEEE